MIVIREVPCAKEMVELGEGLADFVGAVIVSLSDGWQPGKDITAIIGSAIQDLVPALQGVDEISEELEDPQTFSNSVYVGLSPIAFKFIKKK